MPESAPTAADNMDQVLDVLTSTLYNLASTLVGEGEESVRLVETAITTAEAACCADADAVLGSAIVALSRAAVRSLAARTPGCLDTPIDTAPASLCIDEDDLEATGIGREELDRMICGQDRQRVRTWLQSLPTEVRVIFALRAMAGFSNADTAQILRDNAGAGALGWTQSSTRDYYRRGLCSLASQLLHATAGR